MSKPKRAMTYQQTQDIRATRDDNITLFGSDADMHIHWREWQDMPEYVHEQLKAVKQVLVHFETKADRQQFAELIGQEVSPLTRAVWYPDQPPEYVSNYRWRGE